MSATRDEVLRASASISETVAEMCDALRIMEIKRPDSIPLQRMYAILSAARAKGWQLVPVQATEEMIEEGCVIDCTRTVCRARLECRDDSGQAIMREKWAAMLNAAPKVGE